MTTAQTPRTSLTWRGRRRRLFEAFGAEGVLSTGALHRLGFSDSAITRLLADGLVVRVHRGVYRAGGTPPNDDLAAAAALTAAAAGRAAANRGRVRDPGAATPAPDATPEDAVLARESAAFRLGFLDFAPAEIHVAVARRHGAARRDGFRVHKAPTLRERDVTVVGGRRCTTPERTILDLADACRRDRGVRLLRRVIRQATVADPELPERLRRRLARERPFRGCRTLEAALALHLPETAIQRSSLESEFLASCVESGIPLPRTNHRVLGAELDVAWVDEQVYGELDTFSTHGGVREFEADRARDATLVVAGWRGLRITTKRLAQERAHLRTQILTLLGLLAP